MSGIVRVVIKHAYDLAVSDLFPDGLPDTMPGSHQPWPPDWTEEHRAAFYQAWKFDHNVFEESSFLKDFQGEVARGECYAYEVPTDDAQASSPEKPSGGVSGVNET